MNLNELDEKVQGFVSKIKTVDQLISALEKINDDYSDSMVEFNAIVKEKAQLNQIGDDVNKQLKSLIDGIEEKNRSSLQQLSGFVEKIKLDNQDLKLEVSKLINVVSDFVNFSKEANEKVEKNLKQGQELILEKIAALHDRVENPPKKGLFGLGASPKK
jgi:uncharacterized phage infection (PIP) family protein YhgE